VTKAILKRALLSSKVSIPKELMCYTDHSIIIIGGFRA